MKKVFSKLCSRSNLCSRSVDRHMRSRDEAAHTTVKFASLCDYSDEEEEEEEEQVGRDVEDSMSEVAKEIASSKLRQNSMKKRKGAEDSGMSKMFVCVKCNKGFQSQKAMCGHMASHSEKRKKSTLSDQKAVMDSHSDDESGENAADGAGGYNWRRSKRVKYSNNVTPAGHNAFQKPNFPGFSVPVVEDEQEEAAKCLMMLSRDSSQLSVNMKDNRLIFKASSGQNKIGVGSKRRFNELMRSKPANNSSSAEVCDDSNHKIDSARINVKASRTLQEEWKHHSRGSEGYVKAAETDEDDLETNMSPQTPDLWKGKCGMLRNYGAKRVKQSNEQVPLQESSPRAHSWIDLNQPASFKDRKFMPC